MPGNLYIKRAIALGMVFLFLVNVLGPIPWARAQDFVLPAPGVMVHLSPQFNPPVLKGIKVHPENPFRFDFILDKGNSQLSNGELKEESSKLIKYFLASLTIPEKDLWVNLSPYEQDRIIPNSFGLTEMGRDLLAEDYMLKQITASLIYPEDRVGKKFWKRIYEESARKFGTTNIPVNTFNKVWIVPEKAVVYENAKAGTVYVVESKLKVMLEQDYLAMQKNAAGSDLVSDRQFIRADTRSAPTMASQIIKEIVIPELTKEINEDKNFYQLRQVYNSLILAAWYKKKIKDSILDQIYTNKNKVAGVNIDDPQETQKIYGRYLRAFKKGVYNYIKEDIDPLTQETIPRKYFSGGVNFFGKLVFIKMGDAAMLNYLKSTFIKLQVIAVQINPYQNRLEPPVDLYNLLVDKLGLAEFFRLDAAFAERGFELRQVLRQFDKELNAFIITDEHMDVLSRLLPTGDTVATNLFGYVLLRESTAQKIKLGDKNAIMALRHEQAHIKYLERHPEFDAKNNEKLLVNEIYAWVYMFVSVYGPDKIFDSINSDWGKSDWLTIAFDVLKKKYIKEQGAARKQIEDRLTKAKIVLIQAFQERRGSMVLDYLLKCNSFDQIYRINQANEAMTARQAKELRSRIESYSEGLDKLASLGGDERSNPTQYKMLALLYYKLFQSIDASLKELNRGEVNYIYPFAGPDIIPNLFALTFRINDDNKEFYKGVEKMRTLLRGSINREINPSKMNDSENMDAYSIDSYRDALNNTPAGKRVIILKGFDWPLVKKQSELEELLRNILILLSKGDKVLILDFVDNSKIKNVIPNSEIGRSLGIETLLGIDNIGGFHNRPSIWCDDKILTLPNSFLLLEKTSAQSGVGQNNAIASSKTFGNQALNSEVMPKKRTLTRKGFGRVLITHSRDLYGQVTGSLKQVRPIEVNSSTNRAMLANKGGIDLTAANLRLQTQNSGRAIKFHLDPSMLHQLQNALGFVPVIINIQPMRNLRAFLGV